jgi:tagatose-6-phosphate ketose/aldose isomerase
MSKLGREEGELQALGALWTAGEIEQQPAMLRRTHAALLVRQGALASFLDPLLRLEGLRLILSGAGTSSFIGECLAPYLATRLPCRVEAIATTDLVCAPHLYLVAESPTLLLSFGRSGSSPESVAAVELAQRCVRDIQHLAITCNRDGALARKLAMAANAIAVLLPQETNDRSFVMTSSFSCMTYAALAVLSGIESMQARLDRLADAVENVITAQAEPMRMLARKGYQRVVYLGSHVFKGLAREAALKLLELTDGAVIAAHDSPLGFRHGPKTIVNDRTLVMLFLSNDEYSRSYEVDLLRELRRDGKAGGLLALSARDEAVPPGVERILIPGMEDAEDVDLLLPFIVAPQIYAFEEAIGRGISPDSPNASGVVHRVVHGVRIHPFR